MNRRALSMVENYPKNASSFQSDQASVLMLNQSYFLLEIVLNLDLIFEERKELEKSLAKSADTLKSKLDLVDANTKLKLCLT